MPQSQRFMQFRYPLPYGAILQEGGVQFVVYSRSATAMRVLLYRRVSDRDPYRTVEFNPATDRWGDLWSMFVPGLTAGMLYHFQADGPYAPERGHRNRSLCAGAGGVFSSVRRRGHSPAEVRRDR
jgi:glycogen operon protein